ncbi:MAG: hypothetical protein ACT4TC_05010 [Myxococcaceae bacterium]
MLCEYAGHPPIQRRLANCRSSKSITPERWASEETLTMRAGALALSRSNNAVMSAK